MLEANGFLPDLSDIPEATWDRVAILWVNYPNNPTAAVASPAFFELLAEHAERHRYLVASDEAGYFRLALVPTMEECQRAVAILEEVL